MQIVCQKDTNIWTQPISQIILSDTLVLGIIDEENLTAYIFNERAREYAGECTQVFPSAAVLLTREKLGLTRYIHPLGSDPESDPLYQSTLEYWFFDNPPRPAEDNGAFISLSHRPETAIALAYRVDGKVHFCRLEWALTPSSLAFKKLVNDVVIE